VIEQALITAFPNSFGHKRYEETEKYNKLFMENGYYHHDTACSDFKVTNNSVDVNLLPKNILEARPAKTELPKYLAEAGNLQFEFLLDFGSFRDIQRHRAVTQRMPLLTMDLGFEDWYMSELPYDVRENAQELLKKQAESISKLNISKEDMQYYTAMGYKTSNRLTGNLPALVYLAELRATRFVHPTLRKRAKQMADTLSELFGSSYGLTMHLDSDIDRFDIKRGEHDITLK
ncbi:MAG: FAD-dependent thymidylate synthase, partial [bacterium]